MESMNIETSVQAQRGGRGVFCDMKRIKTMVILVGVVVVFLLFSPLSNETKKEKSVENLGSSSDSNSEASGIGKNDGVQDEVGKDSLEEQVGEEYEYISGEEALQLQRIAGQVFRLSGEG